MDDVHLLTARHLRYELRRGGKVFSSNFGAREVCIAPQVTFVCYSNQSPIARTRPQSGWNEVIGLWLK